MHVEIDGVAGNVLHPHVGNENFLHDAAATARALESQPDVRAHESAIVHMDVAHAAGHFAADGETAVRMVNGAAFNQHVVRRRSDAAPGGVLAGFQTNAV